MVEVSLYQVDPHPEDKKNKIHEGESWSTSIEKKK